MAKVYDAVKGEWVAASKEETAHHEAVAEGKPLPSDRTAQELAEMEPAFAGPVITAGPAAGAAPAVAAPAGAGAGRAAGTSGNRAP